MGFTGAPSEAALAPVETLEFAVNLGRGEQFQRPPGAFEQREDDVDVGPDANRSEALEEQHRQAGVGRARIGQGDAAADQVNLLPAKHVGDTMRLVVPADLHRIGIAGVLQPEGDSPGSRRVPASTHRRALPETQGADPPVRDRGSPPHRPGRTRHRCPNGSPTRSGGCVPGIRGQREPALLGLPVAEHVRRLAFIGARLVK